MLTPAVDVRRGADRAVTRLDGLESRHSFSFGRHYDATDTSYGLLLASNNDVLQAGAGFGEHAHRDLEIITWVLAGTLVHHDSAGHTGVVHPGLLQRMTAGTGVRHSETNDSWRLSGAPPHRDPVDLVQMWVIPDEPGLAPSYQQRDVEPALQGGGLVLVASGRPGYDDAVRIANRNAALHVARLLPGQSVQLPDAPYVHLFVARGEVDLEGAGALVEGDAARLTATGGRRVTATTRAELLGWEMHAALTPG